MDYSRASTLPLPDGMPGSQAFSLLNGEPLPNDPIVVGDLLDAAETGSIYVYQVGKYGAHIRHLSMYVRYAHDWLEVRSDDYYLTNELPLPLVIVASAGAAYSRGYLSGKELPRIHEQENALERCRELLNRAMSGAAYVYTAFNRGEGLVDTYLRVDELWLRHRVSMSTH